MTRTTILTAYGSPCRSPSPAPYTPGQDRPASRRNQLPSRTWTRRIRISATRSAPSGAPPTTRIPDRKEDPLAPMHFE